jgi:hypothetical protein
MDDYHCDTCGRDYDDATPEEIVRWTITGYCCTYCFDENQEPDVENAHENYR